MKSDCTRGFKVFTAPAQLRSSSVISDVKPDQILGCCPWVSWDGNVLHRLDCHGSPCQKFLQQLTTDRTKPITGIFFSYQARLWINPMDAPWPSRYQIKNAALSVSGKGPNPFTEQSCGIGAAPCVWWSCQSHTGTENPTFTPSEDQGRNFHNFSMTSVLLGSLPSPGLGPVVGNQSKVWFPRRCSWAEPGASCCKQGRSSQGIAPQFLVGRTSQDIFLSAGLLSK